jgi:hypothetical protein
VITTRTLPVAGRAPSTLPEVDGPACANSHLLCGHEDPPNVPSLVSFVGSTTPGLLCVP